MFYHKGKKVIKPIIENYMTALTLAIWISDDGGYTQYGVRIATNSFTLSEVELLITVLKSKFNLTATVQRRTKSNKEICWRIRFSSKYENIDLLRTLVKPHLIPSMYYKLNI